MLVEFAKISRQCRLCRLSTGYQVRRNRRFSIACYVM